jgi:hypothetical protein
MKISSKFHDYYDCGVKFGHDPKSVYTREEKTFKLKQSLFPTFQHYDGKAGRANYDSFWIGFCGVWYFGIKESFHGLGRYQVATLERFIYDTKEIEEILGKYNKNSFFDFWSKSKGGIRIIDINRTHDEKLFLEYDCPILHFKKDHNGFYLTTNPKLKEYNFEKVFDPFSAFQEIEMFLGNSLAKQIDPPILSDKGRITAHGFDLKTSFRREGPPNRKIK